MRIGRNWFALIFLAALFASACGEATTETGSGSADNVNAATPEAAGPLAATTPTPAPTANDAPTLSPVFRAYCEAMEKKDEAAIRKVYSSDTIKFFEEEAKADNITMMEYLSAEQVSTKLCEARNEEITGDTAVAEVRSTSMPNGLRVIFVKEGGEWKLTNRSPDIPKK
ncbi:MAG TPA: nuclear transport factor 2 family protein [Pyrinomonadaceae bacterium]|nr:nuclear transport factor 2 family protein [Pyrinomonadaceae bacterium]HMP65207.1 nuclear transport factor 2 family protein [Pyrinomonadaceae bacterium]